jgi:hypothetical protein
MEEGKQKKRIWPFFLIAGIVVLLVLIILVVVLVVGGIVFYSVLSYNNKKNAYSYANTVATMNTSNMPTTVNTPIGTPYDYTFVNDGLTKDSSGVEAWINKYYPGSTIQKNSYNSEGDGLWVVNSTTPMNSVSIDGVIVNYNEINIRFSDGYAEVIMFVLDGSDMSLFNSMYSDFEALYGPQQVYVGEVDLLTQLTDPSYEYLSYSWYDSEFDGYYSLILTRSCHQSQPEITVSIEKF